MTVVYLMRHGESDFNREGLFRGTLNVPLNEHGRLQAEALGRALAKVDITAVYSSPLARALDTAHAVALPHDLEVEVDDAFRNINLGQWQGKRKVDIARSYPEDWRLWTTVPEQFLPPGGESVGEVQERAWAGLVALTKRRHRDETIAVITHRSVIKTLLGAVLGLKQGYFWKFYLDPASYCRLTYRDDEGFVLNQVNISSGVPGSPMEEY